jgi:hypothetical protein
MSFRGQPPPPLILIGLLFFLPMLGAQLGVDLNIVSQLIASSTDSGIRTILRLTGNMLWLPTTLVLTIGLLQPTKGVIVALQWSMGMHGFGYSQKARSRRCRTQLGIAKVRARRQIAHRHVVNHAR